MDDPTIEESPSSKKTPQQAIQQGRLKNSRYSYRIATMNMNGESVGKGTAEKRRDLLSIIFGTFGASLVCCQELPGRFKDIVSDECSFVKNEKEAGVIWCRRDFQESVDGPRTTDTRMRKIKDDIAKQPDVDVSELLLRVAIVKLTTQRTETQRECPSFIAASWHGPHTGYSLAERHNTFRGLTRFLGKLCDQEGGIPYIIGGDFNFNTLDIDLDQDVCVPRYELSARSEQAEASSRKYIPFKDNFVFLRRGLSLSYVRSYDYNSDLSKTDKKTVAETKVERGHVTDTLDHEPIFAILYVSPSPTRRSTVVQALVEKFEHLNVSKKR